MPSRIDDLFARIGQLELEAEQELNRARERWRYRVDARRVRFEQDVHRLHKRLRQSIPRFIRESSPLNLLTAPIIYAVVAPLAVLDLSFSIYQLLCFPIYRIAHVRRSDYILIDRHHLAYLNGIEKVNCAYCSYANGVLAYTREIAGRTEQYWCPIRHARRMHGAHAHYREFVEYGDAEGYHRRLPMLREELERDRAKAATPKREAL
jgi:hypothetical protein